jgi:hypothetical protein
MAASGPPPAQRPERVVVTSPDMLLDTESSGEILSADEVADYQQLPHLVSPETRRVRR